MFDLGASELLLIVIIAVIVIGPKDLPLAMRTAGQWMGKIRRVSGHFRSGIDTMIREAELEEMEKKWKAQNEAIMEEHPADPLDMAEPPPVVSEPASAEAAVSKPAASEPASAEAAAKPRPASKAEALSKAAKAAEDTAKAEPQLPLPPP